MKKPRDLCDRFHRTPGDTSEGRWITVLFCVFGVCLCAVDFLLYAHFRYVPALMIFASLVSIAFTCVEISHLFIRKYWFRDHRNLAVTLCLLIYYALIFLVIYLVVCFQPRFLVWDLTYIYFPFFLMPPLIVVIILFYFLLHVIGG